MQLNYNKFVKFYGKKTVDFFILDHNFFRKYYNRGIFVAIFRIILNYAIQGFQRELRKKVDRFEKLAKICACNLIIFKEEEEKKESIGVE